MLFILLLSWIIAAVLVDIVEELSGEFGLFKYLRCVILKPGNTSYIIARWSEHPQLKGKYYWTDGGIIDSCDHWSLSIQLWDKSKESIDRILKRSIDQHIIKPEN